MADAIATSAQKSYTTDIPIYPCVSTIPLLCSVAEGVSMGIISYVVINLVCNKGKGINIKPVKYVLAVRFILKYIFL